MTKYQLHIRRGVEICDDPHRRCYNGAYAKSHWEWSEWESWFMSYDTKEHAKRAVRLFQRESQQFKIVEVEAAND